MAVFHDITERKRLENIRRDFVANVSHELRTPLTAIRGSVETLLDGALESGVRARDFVEMIARQSKQLEHLVEDLMDLARIEAGEARPHITEFQAVDPVDSALNTVANLAGEKAVNLAQRSQIIAGLDPIEVPLTILEMAAEAQEMIAGSLNAFVQEEIDLARAVCRRDDIVDQLNHTLLEEMISVMMNERRTTRSSLEIILVGRHLERIGDGATNISEAVVFMIQGTIIRHQPDCNSAG